MINFNENVVGNLELSESVSGLKQSIYASQLYGTNFSVYGEFRINTVNGLLESLTLFMVNYKGILDIGFVKDSNPKCTIQDIETDSGVIPICNLDIQVKAVVGGNTDYSIGVDVSDESMNRFSILESQNEDKKPEPKFFRVDRELLKMWPDGKVFENGVFDNEFNYRDGFHYEQRVIRNVPEEYYGTNHNRVNPKIDFYQDPGWFCKTSTLRIIR